MIEFNSIFLNRNGKNIFSGLDLSISDGEKVLLQGKSGAGKTTVFRLILGLEQPDRGDIFFNGRRICAENIHDIRQQIFYLSQDIDLKQGRVGQIIDEVAEVNKVNSHLASRKRWMDFLELDEKILGQNIKKLSGGERQRTGLLLCLLLQRPVWLLDEPTSALDDKMKEKISQFVISQDKTVFIISHEKLWGSIRGITIGKGEQGGR